MARSAGLDRLLVAGWLTEEGKCRYENEGAQLKTPISLLANVGHFSFTV